MDESSRKKHKAFVKTEEALNEAEITIKVETVIEDVMDEDIRDSTMTCHSLSIDGTDSKSNLFPVHKMDPTLDTSETTGNPNLYSGEKTNCINISPAGKEFDAKFQVPNISSLSQVLSTCNMDVTKLQTAREEETLERIRVHPIRGKNVCSTCGRAFTSAANLRTHIRTHTGERPFACNICTRAFHSSSNLNAHMKAHTGDKQHACNICSKTFISHSVLKTHLRTHTGDKPYVCNICNKGFAQVATLQYHMKTHTGERSYVCNKCQNAFRRLAHLRRHQKVHQLGNNNTVLN